MSSLHRTQIYIEEDQIQLLKLEAERNHLAISELVRRAIQYFLQGQHRNIDWDRDPLTRAIGQVKLDVTDASENHDHYLYGHDKKRS